MRCFRSSAPELAALTLAALLAGCGGDDGARDYANGREALKAGEFVKADKLFAKAVEASPENADALVSLAETKLRLGAIPAAKEALAKALKAAPDARDALLVSGQVAYHAKDYPAALKAFAAVAENKDASAAERAAAYTGIGIVEHTRNDRVRARLALLKALGCDRRNAAARYHLGLVYRDAYDYPEAALDQFELYVRLPVDSPSHVKRAQRTFIPDLKQAIARRAAERPGASKRDSNAAAKRLSDGDAAMKKGNFKIARASYEQALGSDPLSYAAALGLAKALEREKASGGQRSALNAYLTAQSLKPAELSTGLAAGALAARLGQHATAVSAYSRILAAYPTNLTALDGLIRELRRCGGASAKTASEYQRYRDSLAKSRSR